MTAPTGTTPPHNRLTMDDLLKEPPTVSVERAAGYLGVSRAYGYQMGREGLLPTIKLGPRRVRVPTAALIRMLTGEDGAA